MTADSSSFDYDAALRACAAGERRALQRLYQQESRYLLGVALRIVRERQLAEDVLHDAFISIWNRAASFDPRRGAGRGWIYSVVRHQALNLVRARDHEVSAGEEEVQALLDAGAAPDAPEAFELHASMGKLNDCLGHLDPPKRSSIVYAYVDGCSHSEIAQRLKAPLGSVKAWIKRGLGALRECMG
ncbi:sigma-70 family RNA polymerase sigma factor [Janthinobacterium agaricidamnosum]|uniref:RNA polymerase sigma factor, sigma-70 family protein n=1 Tax=Janthinobacterium agaricidamnosum NBRC 102515 = DSM 9628 TaxID=1349767 RepID=W0V9D3_9BURK|nr:sigma-70 family RNA polymerase sigma factor [Janthinobacterium agaricidamnosum]CDG85429.1 RNA polymerase sigma factor, sigma-70 family protein [Janthinobacterium agaricidamnosum NBRC 102515 = DSM 9628]